MAKRNEEIVLEVAKKESAVSTIALIIASLLCILTGVVLLFIPQVTDLAIVYIYCAGLIIWGLVVVVRYFQSASYKKYHDYSFTVGASVIVLGCCGLVRAADIALGLQGFIGLAVLILGINMMQNTIRMKYTMNVLWIVELVFAIAAIICAIFVLAGFDLILSLVNGFAYWTLVIAGALSLISIPIVALGIRRDQKKEQRKSEFVEMVSNVPLEQAASATAIDVSLDETAATEEDITPEIAVTAEAADDDLKNPDDIEDI